MAGAKKKDVNTNPQTADNLDDELEEGLGSKLVIVFVTLLIIIIWLGILVLLIKGDVGGFGSTVLKPFIKDVPYLNWILPEETSSVPEDTEYQFETIDDAVLRIKELEAMLDEALGTNLTDAESIAALQKQIDELSVYKEKQEAFEKIKEQWYEDVVFSDEAISYDEYKTFYESIDPENAEVLYKQVVEQMQYDEKVKEYVKTYSSMKPKEAAAIFDTMTDDLQLVADILENMGTSSRSAILGKMDPDIAAKITAIMEPDQL